MKKYLVRKYKEMVRNLKKQWNTYHKEGIDLFPVEPETDLRLELYRQPNSRQYIESVLGDTRIDYNDLITRYIYVTGDSRIPRQIFKITRDKERQYTIGTTKLISPQSKNFLELVTLGEVLNTSK